MPTRIGFSAYKLKIRDKYSQAFWIFRQGSLTDGFDVIHNAFSTINGKLTRLGHPKPGTDMYSDDRGVKLTNYKSDAAAGTVSGILFIGESGKVRDVVDFDDPISKAKYTVQKNEGMLLPLYFQFHFMEDRDSAIALFQTYGLTGLKGTIDHLLRISLSKHIPPLTSKITQLLDKSVLLQLAKQGKLQDVYLINTGKTQTSKAAMESNTIGKDRLIAHEDKLSLRLHKKGGWGMEALQSLFSKLKKNPGPLSIVTTPGFDPDDMIIEIEHNGSRQRFSLLNPDDSPVKYDKTDQLAYAPDGFPTRASLEDAADEVWNDIKQIIV